MVFDGEELLEFAARSIRNEVDHISVTYQTTSYFGNPSGSELLPLLKRLKSINLIDELVYYEPNLRLTPKENELRLRNLGLEISKKAGCTHHISADVDEFCKADQLAYAKTIMENDYDCSLAPLPIYYKDPTFRVNPDPKLLTTFIHPVSNPYEILKFPFPIEPTRRFAKFDKIKIFTKEEVEVHHMSYIRKDIRKKFLNSDNGRFYKIEAFMNQFENYKLGDRVCLLPDFKNRRTIQVENTFGINMSLDGNESTTVAVSRLDI